MTALSMILVLVLGAAAADPVAAAKDVIAAHEGFAAAADLDQVMTNFADDIVVLVPNTPLVRGREAFREFYRGILAQGRWEFRHEYQGAVATGDAVILDGVARGTLTAAGGQRSPFANNFLIILRRQADGRFRIAYVSFAPDSAR